MWKKIAGWPYSVSDTGEVRNDRTNKILVPMRVGRKRKQYSVVALSFRGDTKRYHVSELVLNAFVGPRPTGHLTLHSDDNTMNNFLGNLRWGTHKENAEDRKNNGGHPNATLTEPQAAEIRLRRASGEKGRRLAVEFGISEQTVCDIAKGRIWG